jgi:hypothetical protein
MLVSLLQTANLGETHRTFLLVGCLSSFKKNEVDTFHSDEVVYVGFPSPHFHFSSLFPAIYYCVLSGYMSSKALLLLLPSALQEISPRLLGLRWRIYRPYPLQAWVHSRESLSWRSNFVPCNKTSNNILDFSYIVTFLVFKLRSAGETFLLS